MQVDGSHILEAQNRSRGVDPFRGVTLLALLLGVIGCANTVDIRVREAPLLQIPTFERVAIPEFDSPNAPAAGALVASKLSAAIQREGAYRLVEANEEQLRELEDAMASSLSRSARSDNQLRAGQIETPQVFIFGTVSQYEARRETRERTAYRNVEVGTEQVARYDVNGNEYYVEEPVYEQQPYTVYDLHHYANLSLVFRVVDVETNRNLADAPYNLTDKSVDKGDVAPDGTLTDEQRQLQSGLIALFNPDQGGEVRTAEEMLQALLNQSVEDFVRKISPHFVTKTKELMESDDFDVVQKGNELANAGAWDDAARLWETPSAKGDAAATNNLGIYHEQREDNERARELYNKALQYDPSSSIPLDNLKTVSRFTGTEEATP